MITELNTNINNLEKGVILTFPFPDSLSPHQEYICYFDATNIIPDTIEADISFDPASYVISGSNRSSLTTIVKAKLSHKIRTKILVRLLIKNTANIVVHNNYILINCALNNTTFSINGKILLESPGNYGPNGGRLFAMSETNQLAPSLVTEGDVLTNTLIPDTTKVTIGKNIDPFTFELKVTAADGSVIESSINNPKLSGYEYSGSFTITKSECVGINLHQYPKYTVLDQYNNWTYSINDRILAQFIPDDISNSYDAIIMLPLKDFSSLNEDKPQSIPIIAPIVVGGVVGQMLTPVTDI
jgi:hypothetical protein